MPAEGVEGFHPALSWFVFPNSFRFTYEPATVANKGSIPD
jgi:hypothetical protein